MFSDHDFGSLLAELHRNLALHLKRLATKDEWFERPLLNSVCGNFSKNWISGNHRRRLQGPVIVEQNANSHNALLVTRLVAPGRLWKNSVHDDVIQDSP